MDMMGVNPEAVALALTKIAVLKLMGADPIWASTQKIADLDEVQVNISVQPVVGPKVIHLKTRCIFLSARSCKLVMLVSDGKDIREHHFRSTFCDRGNHCMFQLANGESPIYGIFPLPSSPPLALAMA